MLTIAYVKAKLNDRYPIVSIGLPQVLYRELHERVVTASKHLDRKPARLREQPITTRNNAPSKIVKSGQFHMVIKAIVDRDVCPRNLGYDIDPLDRSGIESNSDRASAGRQAEPCHVHVSVMPWVALK